MAKKSPSTIPFHAFMIGMFAAGAYDQQIATLPGVGPVTAFIAWAYFCFGVVALTWMMLFFFKLNGQAINGENLKAVREASEMKPWTATWGSRILGWTTYLLIGLSGHPIMAVSMLALGLFVNMIVRIYIKPDLQRKLALAGLSSPNGV